MHTNIWSILMFAATTSLSNGIWSFAVLSGYLYQLTGDYRYVGYAEGMQGAVKAFVAIPSGYLADKYKRSSMLKASSILGFISVAVITYALIKQLTGSNNMLVYYLMCCGLSLRGAFAGAYNPAIIALFADSLPDGSRSLWFSRKFFVTKISSIAGPVSGIIMFYFFGDKWTLKQLATVFLVGVTIGALPSFLLWIPKDENVQQSDLIQKDESKRTSAPVTRFCCCTLTSSSVALILVSKDAITGIASGMTIKFFPLFFKNEVGLEPIYVNCIFVASVTMMAISSLVAQKISEYIGRIQTLLIFRAFGSGLLIVMALMPKYWTRAWIIVPIYLVRTTLMNCGKPLQKSILMDYVKKKDRAKWGSVESLTSFGWSGSAMIGGWLTEKYGFGTSFIATACLQYISTAVLIPLLSIIPNEKK